MQNIETIEHLGNKIDIFHDFDAENPRDFDNLGTLAIRNHCGDEEPDPDFNRNNCIWLPVYRYEHSGIAFNTVGFSCPWDSGQTGYIYVTKAKVREEFHVTRISPHLRDRVYQILKNEVEIFSLWANGETYGFDINDGEDSCWGFYGLDDCIDAAKEALQ